MRLLASKRCRKCSAEMSVKDFSKDSQKSDGLRPYCKPCDAEFVRRRRERNPQAFSDKSRAARNARMQDPAYRAKQAEYYREWRARDPARQRELCRRKNEGQAKKPGARAIKAVRQAVRKCLTAGKSSRTFDMLGYTAVELRSHLERQFLRGMSWANYGEWHIDHIIPLSSFVFESADDIEFRRAWALTNLRPLWAKDNLSKGATVETLL